MRISLNWLKEYVDIDVGPDELAEVMTMLGMEVESVDRPGDEVQGVVVGKVLEKNPHPDADKLTVCKTDVGGEAPLQIICGATNFDVGDKVPTAVVGSVLPGDFKITKRKMRGVESQGMMCSTKELGLGDDHMGLMVLDEDAPLGVDIREYLGMDDVIIEIEVTPNRGDWAGMIGVARELAAYYDRPMRLPEVTFKTQGTLVSQTASVTIEDPDLCPRYCARTLTNVKVRPSPEWMQNRIIAAGMRPINNIVDITNYVLLETGHPLHAFDHDKMAEGRVVVRRARAGERLKTIDEEERTLAESMLVIADAKDPIAVAGVMGGFDSEVSDATSRVLLESACFEPGSIRKTARQLNMISEASQRFQRGADIEMVPYALDRAAQLMAKHAGGSVAEGIIDEYPGKHEPVEVTLRYDRCNTFLGTEIPSEEQAGYLKRLGFQIKSNGEACTAGVPTWRPDVTIEPDLIEEVARLYGYNRIGSSLPKVRKTEHVYDPYESAIRFLKERLAGMGLVEMVNYTFIGEDDLQKTSLSDLADEAVRLDNPLSETMAVMRPSLLPGLVKTAALNLRHGAQGVAAYEIGPVYAGNKAEDLPDQQPRLALVMAGQAGNRHWSISDKKSDIFDIKGVIENVLSILNIEKFGFEAENFGPFQPGQSAVLTVNGNPVGHLGEVKPDISKAFDTETTLFACELQLTPLLKNWQKAAAFESIPTYPESARDIAVVVDDDLPAGKLLETAERAGGKYLKRAELIDIYRGKPIPAGKKSVAISLAFQAPDRTLTDQDTEKSWKKIVKTFEHNFKAELR